MITIGPGPVRLALPLVANDEFRTTVEDEVRDGVVFLIAAAEFDDFNELEFGKE